MRFRIRVESTKSVAENEAESRQVSRVRRGAQACAVGIGRGGASFCVRSEYISPAVLSDFSDRIRSNVPCP